MRILGVDPGTIFTGYGIIDFDNNELKYVSAGVIKIPTTKEMPPRLETIYNELNKLIKQFKPDEFALETAFYGKNVQSALKIGYARGVSMLVAIHNDLAIKEYSPREIKICGRKRRVIKRSSAVYDPKTSGASKTKIKYDESDALAVAICHAFKTNSFSKRAGTGKSL